jgi:hypothetical protein
LVHAEQRLEGTPSERSCCNRSFLARHPSAGAFGRFAYMNIPTILAFAVLGSLVANALHWRGRKNERFLYHPATGWLRILFNFWTVATVIVAGLFLASEIPAPTFLGVALGMTIAHELYSIARRQHQRGRA